MGPIDDENRTALATFQAVGAAQEPDPVRSVSKRKIIRCRGRDIARQIYYTLRRDVADLQPT